MTTAVRRSKTAAAFRRRWARQRITPPALIMMIMGMLMVVTYLSQHPRLLLAIAALLAAAAVGFVYLKMHQADRRKVQLKTVEQYRQLNPTQFEHAIADLCRRDGCTRVTVVGGAGDLAADVLATTPDGRRIMIQAKRYGKGNSVGSPEVQKVGGTYAVIHGAALAAVVTTSHFTPAAIDYAKRAGIGLLDAQGLAGWAARTGPAPWK